MTTPLDLAAALAPVRDALRLAARAEAAQALNDAETQAQNATTAARRRAETARASARAAGRADAERALSSERAGRQRHARSAALQARNDAYQRLHELVRGQAAQLATGPDYAELRAVLVGTARRMLAADAVITEAPGGGVLARSGDRSLDLSLAAFADRAADRLAIRLGET